MEEKETLCLLVANIIRERSERGQLVLPEEILKQLTEQGLLRLGGDPQELQFESVLRQTVEKNGDLKEISGSEGGPSYYSVRSLDESYARLLIRQKEDPLSFMAEIIRENSAIYPRPVPISLFRESPFDLTQEEILSCLQKMEEQNEFQDIVQTTSSIGTIFLYSTRHLEPDYASSLAEWLDVGQAENP